MNLRIHNLTLGFVQSYLIETPDGLFLVDCGMPGSEKAILRVIQQLGGRRLKLIFITHAHVDHAGSAATLKRLTGASLAIHRLDAEALEAAKMLARGQMTPFRLLVALALPLVSPQPARADILLEDEQALDRLGLPGRVVHLPGHTPGSCGLLLDGKTGFLGDLVSTRSGLCLQHHLIDDQAALLQSFRRIRELELDTVYPGHGARSVSGEELRLLIDARLACLECGG